MLHVLAFVLATFQVNSESHEHSQQMIQCGKVCAECQVMCDACFKHCTALAAEDKKHARPALFCLDCSECCKSCATLCARKGPLAPHMLECCAACCDDCAKSCE